jgi:hypothetical protein
MTTNSAVTIKKYEIDELTSNAVHEAPNQSSCRLGPPQVQETDLTMAQCLKKR